MVKIEERDKSPKVVMVQDESDHQSQAVGDKQQEKDPQQDASKCFGCDVKSQARFSTPIDRPPAWIGYPSENLEKLRLGEIQANRGINIVGAAACSVSPEPSDTW